MTANAKINDCFLSGLVSNLALTASSFGVVLAMVNELSSLYSSHFKWAEDDKDLNVTILTSAGVVGIMIGSGLANFIVEKGRRRTILISQVIALIGALMGFILNLWVLIAARIIYGIATGIVIVAVALYFSETIPASRTGKYGFAINFGITGGVTIILCLGVVKPTDEAPESTKLRALMLFTAVPVLIAIINMLTWTFIFKEEPIHYCLKNEDKDDYRAQLTRIVSKVYRTDNEAAAQSIIDEKRKELIGTGDNIKQEVPGAREVMFDPKYSKATWISIAMAVINQLDGINVLNFYSNTIFATVLENNQSATVWASVMVGVA